MPPQQKIASYRAAGIHSDADKFCKKAHRSSCERCFLHSLFLELPGGSVFRFYLPPQDFCW